MPLYPSFYRPSGRTIGTIDEGRVRRGISRNVRGIREKNTRNREERRKIRGSTSEETVKSRTYAKIVAAIKGGGR